MLLFQWCFHLPVLVQRKVFLRECKWHPAARCELFAILGVASMCHFVVYLLQQTQQQLMQLFYACILPSNVCVFVFVGTTIGDGECTTWIWVTNVTIVNKNSMYLFQNTQYIFIFIYFLPLLIYSHSWGIRTAESIFVAMKNDFH